MSLNLAEQYYLKAKDNYPYCMEEAMEQLNYALAYDPEHAGSNCLMGKVYMEQMDDLTKAEEYFEQALSSDPQHKGTFMAYARLLIRQRRFEQAKSLLNTAANLPGICQASVFRHRGLIYEYLGNFAAALRMYHKSMLDTYNENFMFAIKEDMERVKAKQDLRSKMNGEHSHDFEQISLKVAYVSTIGSF